MVGGGSRLSREEKDEIRAEVDAEVRDSKRRKHKGPKSRKPNEDDLGSLFGEGITGKLPRFANRVTLKVCCNIYAVGSHFIFVSSFRF